MIDSGGFPESSSLAVHDLHFVEIQLKSQGPKPISDCGPKTSSVCLVDFFVIFHPIGYADRYTRIYRDVENEDGDDTADGSRGCGGDDFSGRCGYWDRTSAGG